MASKSTPANSDAESSFESDGIKVTQTNNLPLSNPREILTSVVMEAHHAGNWQKPYGPERLDKFETALIAWRDAAVAEALEQATTKLLALPTHTPPNMPRLHSVVSADVIEVIAKLSPTPGEEKE